MSSLPAYRFYIRMTPRSFWELQLQTTADHRTYIEAQMHWTLYKFQEHGASQAQAMLVEGEWVSDTAQVYRLRTLEGDVVAKPDLSKIPAEWLEKGK